MRGSVDCFDCETDLHIWRLDSTCLTDYYSPILNAVYGLRFSHPMNLCRELRNLAWRASLRGFARGTRVTRYYMYERLRAVGLALPDRCGRVLAISHSENLADLLSLEPSEVVSASYPEHSMLALSFDDESFDFILSDQVLEHIQGSPRQAIDECYRVLRPGGIAIHTTCFLNPIHGAPHDYWRFTPFALSFLHANWREVIEVGGWGNFQAMRLIQEDLRMLGVPHARWHPLHKLAVRNDPAWPISTWIVARK